MTHGLESIAYKERWMVSPPNFSVSYSNFALFHSHFHQTGILAKFQVESFKVGKISSAFCNLLRIPSNYFYTSSFREQWRIIKIGEYPLGFGKYILFYHFTTLLLYLQSPTFGTLKHRLKS